MEESSVEEKPIMRLGVYPFTWFVRVIWIELERTGKMELQDLEAAYYHFEPFWEYAVMSSNERINNACATFFNGAAKARETYLPLERQASRENVNRGDSKWISGGQTSKIIEYTEEERHAALCIFERYKKKATKTGDWLTCP